MPYRSKPHDAASFAAMGSAAVGVAAVGPSRLGVTLEIAHSFAPAPAC